MSNDFITYAFIAGELSPRLFGRTDLEKYDLGLALAKNYFIDYRGGLSTRPGTEFLEYIQHDEQDLILTSFEFAPDEANTYLLLLGDEYVRFLQQGSYLLEADVTITGITQDDPGVVTATAHPYSNGDWIKISGVAGMTEVNGMTYEVASAGVNDFALVDTFGVNVDTGGFTAYSSGGVANRIYTVVSPYPAEDLALLEFTQIRDTIRITHPDYATRNLVRSGQTSWAFSTETFANGVTPPMNIATAPSNAGNYGGVYAVTAVDIDGKESTIADFGREAGSGALGGAQVTVTWDPVDEAVKYNVYRSLFQVAWTTASTIGQQMGFVGSTVGTVFNDNGITSDFTKSYPQQTDPFADGEITRIVITAVGSAYDELDTVSISDPDGSGFVGFPIVKAGGPGAGEILGVWILNRGSGYTAPTVSFGTSTGSGATATATAGPIGGNFPHTSALFQQRQVYAATDNNPLTIFASRTGQTSNFDVSAVVVDSDAYQYDLDSGTLAPIRHLVTTRAGLLVMAQNGVWQLVASEGSAITPTNALADPQSYVGISTLPPLNIESDILYVQNKIPFVRKLSYNDFSKLYAGEDMSILSNHLFEVGKSITSWTYAQAPYHLVWAVRSDGIMLCFTIEETQDVFAWTQHSTKGLFKAVETIEENDTDVTYLLVERIINGNTVTLVEKFASREFTYAEDAFCVDSGLQLTPTYPAAALTAGAATGTGVTFTTDASVFVAGDVDKVIRACGGAATVTAYVSGTEVTADIWRDITDLVEEDPNNTPKVCASGDWTLDATVTNITGLDHLEGEAVDVLADGNVIAGRTVVGGALDTALPQAASRIIVGLNFKSIAQTLPPSSTVAVIEGRAKDILSIAYRINETRGLKTGTSLDRLFEQPERTLEDWGEPMALKSRTETTIIAGEWDVDTQLYFVQEYPLPATILGIAQELDLGDDRRETAGSR